jgi:hypothetical protein
MQLHYLEFKFSSNRDKWEAFKNLGRSAVHFEGFQNLVFGKAMGTGSGNGFSVIPSISKYGFITCFNTQKADRQAIWESPVFSAYRDRADSYFHMVGKPIKSHGKWEGENPFEGHELKADPGKPVAVITRATIRTRRLVEFWRNVPKTSKFMFNHPAAIYQTGIGEYPLFMQATFSIWKSRKKLVEAAYSDTVHGEIVKKTRARNWYKEELFAEFSLDYAEKSGAYYPDELNCLTQP